MHHYEEKRNQESHFSVHLKENIQIIYDLQSKCNELYQNLDLSGNKLDSAFKGYQSPERQSMSFEKMIEQNEYLKKQNKEYKKKIVKLKEQGNRINLKWKSFFE